MSKNTRSIEFLTNDETHYSIGRVTLVQDLPKRDEAAEQKKAEEEEARKAAEQKKAEEDEERKAAEQKKSEEDEERKKKEDEELKKLEGDSKLAKRMAYEVCTWAEIAIIRMLRLISFFCIIRLTVHLIVSSLYSKK